MSTQPPPDSSLTETLCSIANALYSPGDISDLGCAESDIDSMREKAHDILPGKKIRVVADWQWWDVPIGTFRLQNNLQPVILFSDRLLQDDSGRFRPGDWIRSTFLVKLHCNCIFESENTFYIMVGKGSRKTVAAHTIAMLY